MTLISYALFKDLPKPSDVDHLPLSQQQVCAKFFTFDTNLRWYVFAGEWNSDHTDLIFYGMLFGNKAKLGYFKLSDLYRMKDRLGIHVIRDMSINSKREYFVQLAEDLKKREEEEHA